MTTVYVRKRKRKDGVTTYLVVLQHSGRGGRQEVLASGLTNKREADTLAREAKTAARQARAGTYRSHITVGQALDLYLTSLAGRPAHASVERNARLHLRPHFEGISLADLTHAQVQARVDALNNDGRAPAMVLKVAGVLGTAIEFCLRRGHFEGNNVARRLDLPDASRKTKDVLRTDEIEPVLLEVPDRWKPYTGLAVYTCMRPGELAGLHRTAVDVHRRIIRVHRSWDREMPKDRDERLVPVSRVALPYLEEAIRRAVAQAEAGREKHGGAFIESPLLFPAADGGLLPPPSDTKLTRMLRTAMCRAAEKGHHTLVTGWTLKCRRKLSDRSMCGFRQDVAAYDRDARCPKCRMRLWPVGHARPVTFYNLRHSGATALIEQGVSATIVAALLGHHDTELTMRTYVNLAPDALVAEVDRGHRRDTGTEPVRTQIKIGSAR